MTMKKSMKFVLLPALLLASASVQAVTCNGSIPASNPNSVYADNNDGTVTDTRTGLMWKKCVEGYDWSDNGGADNCSSSSTSTFTWQEALNHAEAHDFASHQDWRLPNIRELRSLVEECRSGPAINDGVFPVNGASSDVWSGSPHASSSNNAWYVSFDYGHADDYGFRYDPQGVRLVRAGQSFDSFVNGVCGTAAGGTFTSAPATNLCTTGAPSPVDGTGPWNWYCNGTSGGTNASCSANIQTYTITASPNPAGSGTASCNPNLVEHGSDTTCTAMPNPGYHFVDWSGDCTGTDTTCTLTNVSADKTVTANFAINEYNITVDVNLAGGGTALCNPNPVEHGTTTTCTATPATGYHFVDWSGDCTGTTCTLNNVSADKTVTANFAINEYNITVDVNLAGGGTALCSPNPVEHGTTTTCTATPATGYHFVDWSGDCAGTDTTCTLPNVSADKTVTANFAINEYNITVDVNLAGGGTALCSPNPVEHDTTTTCTATSNLGYTFTGWGDDCTDAGTDAICTLTNVSADKTVTANFEPNTTWTLQVPEGPQAGEDLMVEVQGSNGWMIDKAATYTDTTASVGAPPPAGIALPHGVLYLKLVNGNQGSGATVKLTFPQGLLQAGASYWKYDPTGGNLADWYAFSGATISGDTVTLTLVDGGAGDHDGVENGVIDDPGSVAVPLLAGPGAAAIPTLSQWATLLLAGLLAAAILLTLRRREGR